MKKAAVLDYLVSSCGGCRRGDVEDELPVNVPNMRPVWTNDQDQVLCKLCLIPFSQIVRRHHCRHCGHIFCGKCSNIYRAIPKLNYKKQVRICIRCNRLCEFSDELIDAIKQNDATRCHMIMQRDGLQLNFSTGQMSPLMHAAVCGNTKIVQLLLQHGADPNWIPDYSHNSSLSEGALNLHLVDAALIHAVKLHHQDIAKDLLAHGADPNPRDHENGDTPLHIAVAHGDVDMARLLIQSGANVTLKNLRGVTPIMLGHECQQSDVCSLLGVPPQPSPPSAQSKTSNSITIQWSVNGSGRGKPSVFEVQWREDKGNWATASDAVSSSFFKKKSLRYGPQYFFRVRGGNAQGWGSWSLSSPPIQVLPSHNQGGAQNSNHLSPSWANKD